MSIALDSPDFAELKRTMDGYFTRMSREVDPELKSHHIRTLTVFVNGFHAEDYSKKNWLQRWMRRNFASTANMDLQKIWDDYDLASQAAAYRQQRALNSRARRRAPRSQPMMVPGHARSGPPPPSPPAVVPFPHAGNGQPGPAPGGPGSYGMAASMDVSGHYPSAASGTPSSGRSRRYPAVPMGGPWNHAQAPPAPQPQPAPSLIAFQRGVAFHPYMPQNGSPPESVQSYPARLPTDQYAYEQAQQQPMGYQNNTYTGYPNLNYGRYYPNGGSPYSG